MHTPLRQPRPRSKGGSSRVRGAARRYNDRHHDHDHDHTSITSVLPFGPLPALILGTFLLCYALVLACLLPMLSVSRDESPLHVRGTVRRKFSGLDGAHLPQKADLLKASSVVRQEFKTVKQELKDIGGKVRQKLHPAYGQLVDEAVGEFSTERERRRKKRQTDRMDAERLLQRGNAGTLKIIGDELPEDGFGHRQKKKRQPLEDAMSHVEVEPPAHADGGGGGKYSPGHKLKKRAKKLRSGIEAVLEQEGMAGLDEIADLEMDRVKEMRNEQHKERQQLQQDAADEKTINTEGDTSISQRNGFAVLGMHRSGTSMLSGLLVSGMGYNVGKPLIGAAFDNEKGFFELRTAVLQSDEFMRKQHVWWASGVVNYDAEKALKMKEANELDFAEGEAALKFLNNPLSTPWLWKDPRLCITIKTWLPLLKTEPAIIFTYRHPLEVAMSLEKREDDFDLEHGLRIWIAYNVRAVQNMKGTCQVLSSNEAILANPLKEVQRIADELTTKCHVPAPPNKLTQEVVDSFIDPKLQHNKQKREAELAKHEILVTRGDKCEIRDYDSNYEAGSTHRERETKMYLKAMNLFCDLNSGEAFKEDYEWPSLR
mmetsp:Transcript_31864/g.93631  ORF Transcript_31864/g.93631 Transcript_31864/m.93631 type:complete len:598 (-) Transcript_31864:2068-3861(-)